MSILHVRHIEAALDSAFTDHVDLADVVSAEEGVRRSTFLTRSLAAFPIVSYTGAPSPEIALGITDGTGDNGIDLIHYDTAQERLYLVQAKWRADGNGSPVVGDVQKFLQGIRDLVNLEFDRFNDKVRALERTITAALDNPRVTVEALFVHTGSQEQTEQIDHLFGDLLGAMNDGGEILS